MINEYELTKRLAEAIIRQVSCRVADEIRHEVPIGISNRHIHLAQQDIDLLFGPGYQLSKHKELQPGQFAAKEVVTLVGPKGIIEKVRVLGPIRKRTQVEISRADAYKLGINPPLRDSGDLKGTPGLVIVGSRGVVTLENGVIIARRHIHMNPTDAHRFSLQDGERVDVEVPGMRGIVFKNVLVRVHRDFELEMHIDLEEGNSADLNNKDTVYILGPSKAEGGWHGN